MNVIIILSITIIRGPSFVARVGEQKGKRGQVRAALRRKFVGRRRRSQRVCVCMCVCQT